MFRDVQKWVWLKTFGAVLALAPAMIYMAVALVSFEDFETAVPFLQYIIAASAALIIGYTLMRRGMEEEERERIRSIVREVLQEQTSSVLSEPSPGLKVIEGGKGVSPLPSLKKEQ